MQKLKLIYIASYSRSGSTVLDAMLGTHPRIEGTGELMRASLKAWIKNEICSCGKPCLECPHWSKIYKRWTEKTGITAQEYIDLQSKFERARRFLRLLRERRNPSAEFLRYRECTVELLRIIAEVSGKDIIVDSSKYPMRALAISMMPEIDFYLLHLVRDARGVAHSMAKSFHKNLEAGITRRIRPAPIVKTALLWNLINFEIQWVRSQLPKSCSLLVRYRDFTDHPVEFIQKFGVLSGIDMQPLIEHMNSGLPVRTYHQVAGNRVRMQDSIQVKKQEEWRVELKPAQKLLVTLLAWPWLKAYNFIGYAQR